MGKFSAGDKIINASGDTATVEYTYEVVKLTWDGGYGGLYETRHFELVPRKFAVGNHARIVRGIDPEYDNEVVYIFEDDGAPEDEDPYCVIFISDDKGEVNFSADEMIPWVPLAGERVLERAENPDDEVGTVIGAVGTDKVRVLWPSFPLAQDWLISDLEPAEDEDVFEVGDKVEYLSPFLSYKPVGTIIGGGTDYIRVEFELGCLATGNYNPNLFSKAA